MNEKHELRQEGINLMDFMFYCLEKWRWFVICMLIVAMGLGIFKYQSVAKENSASNNEKAVIEDSDVEQVPDYYAQAIEELESDLEVRRVHLSDSAIMQINPYHVSIGTLSYYIECKDNESDIINAYTDFVTNGAMANKLFAIDSSLTVEELQYLIACNSNSETDDQNLQIRNLNDSDLYIKVLEERRGGFQIKMKMPDDDLLEGYLKHAEEIIEEYSAQIKTKIKTHELILLSSVLSEKMDSELQEYQSSKRLEYKTTLKELQTLRTEYLAIQNTQGEKDAAQTVTTDNSILAAERFSILGLFLGTGFACMFLWIRYMFSGKLQDIEHFKERFEIPLIGMAHTMETKRKIFGFIDAWIYKLRGGFYPQIGYEEQIKIMAANIEATIVRDSCEKNMRKIMIAGTLPEKMVVSLYTQLTAETKNVIFSSYKQIIFQASALRELENYDGILFIEKKGTSSLEHIVQEKKLATDRKVNILGMIVLC
nr:hypothetical protein [uncultured Schaedlerella sp.]